MPKPKTTKPPSPPKQVVSTLVTEDDSPEELAPPELIIIKTANAEKLSSRAQGKLTYCVRYGKEDQSLYLQVLANESGGYFSLESVPFSKIALCLAPYVHSEKPFSAAIFRPAFISPSQNNAGFLAAILKAEGLVHSTEQLYLLQVDAIAIKRWSSDMLQLVGSTSSDTKDEDEATINRVMHSVD